MIERYGQSLSSDRRLLLEQYRLVDMARKVVGSAAWVPAAGSFCCSVPRRPGSAAPAGQGGRRVGCSRRSPGASDCRTQGERVVCGQRLMQATSDIFLGWARADGIDGGRRDCYCTAAAGLGEGIAEPESMVPDGMRAFGELCGATLARAHARSGDRIAIAAYLGGGEVFDRALVRFAERYADQNEQDHRALVDAVRSGRVKAETA